MKMPLDILNENQLAFDTYFVMQGTVVSGVHPDDSLQTGRRTRRLRYRSAGWVIGLRH